MAHLCGYCRIRKATRHDVLCLRCDFEIERIIHDNLFPYTLDRKNIRQNRKHIHSTSRARGGKGS